MAARAKQSPAPCPVATARPPWRKILCVYPASRTLVAAPRPMPCTAHLVLVISYRQRAQPLPPPHHLLILQSIPSERTSRGSSPIIVRSLAVPPLFRFINPRATFPPAYSHAPRLNRHVTATSNRITQTTMLASSFLSNWSVIDTSSHTASGRSWLHPPLWCSRSPACVCLGWSTCICNADRIMMP